MRLGALTGYPIPGSSQSRLRVRGAAWSKGPSEVGTLPAEAFRHLLTRLLLGPGVPQMKMKSLVLLAMAIGCGLVAMLGVRQVLSGDKGPAVDTVKVLLAV